MQHMTQYLFLVFLGGCALSKPPDVPTAPEPVPLVMQESTPPYCPLDRIEIALLPRHTEQLPPLPVPVTAPRKGSKPLTPVQLVTEAQRAARVEPSERGYVGGSGEHVYRWAPGKVYTVYLTKKHGTGIFLPPGERLVSGLYLDGDAYEVKTERAGTEAGAYDALTIRPLADSGEVDAFLLTEAGRRYLLHFVVGQTGMLAVTFEGPRVVTQARTSEPPLILPRPPQ